MLQMGWPELEWTFRIKKAFDHLHNGFKLPETIRSFGLCNEFRITNQFSLKRFAVTNLIIHQRLNASAFRSSSCSLTISRVMRSFSIFVFPYAKLRRCA